MFIICFHRFLLHLSCQSPVLEGPASFSVVETNAFKHLNHLSLRLAQGSDKHVRDYLAVCLSSLKVGSFSIINKAVNSKTDLNVIWSNGGLSGPWKHALCFFYITCMIIISFYMKSNPYVYKDVSFQCFRQRSRPWRLSLRKLKMICPGSWVMLNRCAFLLELVFRAYFSHPSATISSKSWAIRSHHWSHISWTNHSGPWQQQINNWINMLFGWSRAVQCEHTAAQSCSQAYCGFHT